MRLTRKSKHWKTKIIIQYQTKASQSTGFFYACIFQYCFDFEIPAQHTASFICNTHTNALRNLCFILLVVCMANGLCDHIIGVEFHSVLEWHNLVV